MVAVFGRSERLLPYLGQSFRISGRDKMWREIVPRPGVYGNLPIVKLQVVNWSWVEYKAPTSALFSTGMIIYSDTNSNLRVIRYSDISTSHPKETPITPSNFYLLSIL